MTLMLAVATQAAAPPWWHEWFVLGVVVVIFVALVKDWAPPDAVMLGGAVFLGLGGVLTPTEVFQGFANESLLTVAALFVVAAAMRETGALDMVGGLMLGKAKTEKNAMTRMGGFLIPLSGFLNNTPIVAMFVPVVVDWCRKNRISPSRLLIPLSFITILGGICTLIGTSTNLVVDGLMRATVDKEPERMSTLYPMPLFELGMVGLPLAVAGMLFMLTIGRRLLPDRKELLEQLSDSMREYLVDMLIHPGCRLAGQTVEQAGLRRLPGLFLIEINRGEQVITPVEPDIILQANDRLTFTGVVSTIIDLERIPGFVPVADEGYASKPADRRGHRLCEAVVSNTSPILRKSIRSADFRALYNAAVVAVHRGGARLMGRIGDIVLRAGDTLLLQAGSHFARAHRNNPDFYLVSSIEEARPVRHDKAKFSLGLLVLLIVLFTTTRLTGLPEVFGVFLVAGLLIATRCISTTDARQSLDWSTVVTIAASFALGRGISKSGLDERAARLLLEPLQQFGPDWGPIVALSLIYLVGVLASELLTNTASAALMFPFAIATADVFGVNPRGFAMAVAFSASAAFATPIGYQTHLMVYGPGGYKFKDFVRIGVPLDLLLWILASVLIPIAWPMR
ncbi:MAG TPA: SLC13 family permease [Phycisphaerae bacterium]|nr:SLC13 family permease [Phycisphaerae bacterium]